jgi:hypothetical protein
MAKLIGTEFNWPRLDRYWLHVGEDGQEKITVETIENAEFTIERNKREYNDPTKRRDMPMRKVASLPGTIIMELCRVNKIGFRELMLGKTARAQHVMNSFLNDPAFRHFRTAPGKVDVGRKMK